MMRKCKKRPSRQIDENQREKKKKKFLFNSSYPLNI
jgi:hypothetical protein